MRNYEDAFRALERDPGYWREAALNEFLSDLGDRMKERTITRADLADAIGATRAYISKALRGEANYTLLTLVKFAMAVGGVIHIHISDPQTATTWTDQPRRDGVVNQNMGEYSTEGAPASTGVVNRTVSKVATATGRLG